MKSERQPAMTRAERRAFGKSRRNTLNRADQALWIPPLNRRDPVDFLNFICAERVQELIPIRMAKMAQSPHNFYRGACHLMAADLSTLPTTGMRVQMVGDAHALNLGAYAAPDGHLVFDITDFDETYPGAWEWDLKRLATSLVLAGDEAGGNHRDKKDAVLALVSSYRDAMRIFGEMTALEFSRFEVRRHTKVSVIRSILGKAELITPKVSLAKLTTEENNQRRFLENPPLLSRVNKELQPQIVTALNQYSERLPPNQQRVLAAYRPVDVAFKVVGVGSIGMRVYIVLLMGDGNDDALFLQLKEQRASCYTNYVSNVPPISRQGQRVSEGQRLLQTLVDPFLGWTAIDGRDFLVRQSAERKASVDPTELQGETLIEFGYVCGQLLAKAHARSGDAIAISAYCGQSDKVDKALVDFAHAYAAQSEIDREALLKAIKEGRVPTQKLL